jgi:hypothetical protein
MTQKLKKFTVEKIICFCKNLQYIYSYTFIRTSKLQKKPLALKENIQPVLGIRDILMRIPGSIPLANGSGSGSNSGSDSFLQ